MTIVVCTGIIRNCPGRSCDRNLWQNKLQFQFVPGQFKIIPDFSLCQNIHIQEIR